MDWNDASTPEGGIVTELSNKEKEIIREDE